MSNEYAVAWTLRIIAVVVAMTAAATPAGAGVILSPIDVVQNTGGNFSALFTIDETIDQSGLSHGFTSGVTDFDSYLATNPLHDYRQADGGEWYSQSGVPSSIIDYDLGELFNIHRLALWNEDLIGIISMSVSTSADDSFTTPVMAGMFMPAGNGLNSPYPAQVFNLAPSVGRYVRLEVTAGPSFAVSMGEIAFDVTPLAAVPEPSTLLLLGCGGLGLFGTKWRRRKHGSRTHQSLSSDPL